MPSSFSSSSASSSSASSGSSSSSSSSTSVAHDHGPPHAMFPSGRSEDMIDNFLMDRDSQGVHASAEFAVTMALSGFGPSGNVMESMIAAMLTAPDDGDSAFLLATLHQLLDILPPNDKNKCSWRLTSPQVILEALRGISYNPRPQARVRRQVHGNSGPRHRTRQGESMREERGFSGVIEALSEVPKKALRGIWEIDDNVACGRACNGAGVLEEIRIEAPMRFTYGKAAARKRDQQRKRDAGRRAAARRARRAKKPRRGMYYDGTSSSAAASPESGSDSEDTDSRDARGDDAAAAGGADSKTPMLLTTAMVRARFVSLVEYIVRHVAALARTSPLAARALFPDSAALGIAVGEAMRAAASNPDLGVRAAAAVASLLTAAARHAVDERDRLVDPLAVVLAADEGDAEHRARTLRLIGDRRLRLETCLAVFSKVFPGVRPIEGTAIASAGQLTPLFEAEPQSESQLIIFVVIGMQVVQDALVLLEESAEGLNAVIDDPQHHSVLKRYVESVADAACKVETHIDNGEADVFTRIISQSAVTSVLIQEHLNKIKEFSVLS